MTNEEAIKILESEWKCIDRNDGINCDRNCENCDLVMDASLIKDAYNMAIKALEHQPCEDCISRAEVHDLLATWLSDYLTDETREALETINGKIGDMPPVTPQQKIGQWIFHKPFEFGQANCNECIECSQCHTWLGHDCYAKTPYCPICGAKMEVRNDRL